MSHAHFPMHFHKALQHQTVTIATIKLSILGVLGKCTNFFSIAIYGVVDALNSLELSFCMDF